MSKSLVNFLKMHGAGNDFIVIDLREYQERYSNLEPFFSQQFITKICDRHYGIGCDQLIFLEQSLKDANVRMNIFNSNGSSAQHCGNGTRCIARYLFDSDKIPTQDSVLIEASDRVLLCFQKDKNTISVNMGPALFEPSDIGVASSQHLDEALQIGELRNDLIGTATVSMGNPHYILVFKNAEIVETLDVARWGEQIGSNGVFTQGVNVSFVGAVQSLENTFRLRVFERGAGITLACGSGSCAAYAALRRHQLIGNDHHESTMHLDGGVLEFSQNNKDDIYHNDIYMSGPAEYVFSGSFHMDGLF